MLVFQSDTPTWRLHTKLYKTHNYRYFSKFRGVKPKIDKLTNSTQLNTSRESQKSWLLWGAGGGGLMARGRFHELDGNAGEEET